MNRRIAILIVYSLILGCTIGCTTKLEIIQKTQRAITPADFVADVVQDISPADDLLIQESLVHELTEIQHEEIEFVTEESLLIPTRVGAAVVVESLVGQVNGRPIFANEILEPIADQLLILSEEVKEVKFDITAFKNIAKQQITAQMREVVESELLLSEARSGMTFEEKQGLFGYLQRVREDMASSAGGSQSAVTRRLLDEEGQTVDEYLDFKQQQLLIDRLLKEKVSPHIQVTWRNVMRQWEMDKDKFNVPGEVTLGMISVSSEALIETVKESFAQGESFSTVATRVGMDNAGLWTSFELDEQGLSGIAVADSIKSYIVALDENEVVGPVKIASSSRWFTIIKMQKPQYASIWDPQVQLHLRNFLFRASYNIEQSRFLERIFADGSYDEFNGMVERILHVAVSRYMH